MIKYALMCGQGHEFDGWFANSDAFDEQRDAGLLSCAHCGAADVAKAIMAPAVPKKANQKIETEELRQVMEKVTSHVEENFDYVGADFAEEARKIHYGETEQRDIYGETSVQDAKDLLDEGVAVAPLPGPPARDKN